MKVSEATLKAALMRLVRERMPDSVSFRHEDKLTSGVPDISIVRIGHTLWLEAKFLNPDLDANGIQARNLVKLWHPSGGRSWALWWDNRKPRKGTHFVHPDVHNAVYRKKMTVTQALADTSTFSLFGDKFDHEGAVEWIERRLW